MLAVGCYPYWQLAGTAIGSWRVPLLAVVDHRYWRLAGIGIGWRACEHMIELVLSNSCINAGAVSTGESRAAGGIAWLCVKAAPDAIMSPCPSCIEIALGDLILTRFP